MPNYDDLVRRSIRKDFAKANFKRNARTPREKKQRVKRVKELFETSEYYKFRKLIVGRLVRVIEQGLIGGFWVEFVRDADRDALNRAAGWDDKKQFLLDGVKFDD